MSMRRAFWIVCDLCKRDDPNPCMYADDVRAGAKADGWKRIKGQDVYPDCQKVKA